MCGMQQPGVSVRAVGSGLYLMRLGLWDFLSYSSCRDGSEVGDCRAIWCNYGTGISQQRSGPDPHGHSKWAASSKDGVY